MSDSKPAAPEHKVEAAADIPAPAAAPAAADSEAKRQQPAAADAMAIDSGLQAPQAAAAPVQPGSNPLLFRLTMPWDTAQAKLSSPHKFTAAKLQESQLAFHKLCLTRVLTSLLPQPLQPDAIRFAKLSANDGKLQADIEAKDNNLRQALATLPHAAVSPRAPVPVSGVLTGVPRGLTDNDVLAECPVTPGLLLERRLNFAKDRELESLSFSGVAVDTVVALSAAVRQINGRRVSWLIRRANPEASRVCFNCLGTGHNANRCEAKGRHCRNCGQLHEEAKDCSPGCPLCKSNAHAARLCPKLVPLYQPAIDGKLYRAVPISPSQPAVELEMEKGLEAADSAPARPVSRIFNRSAPAASVWNARGPPALAAQPQDSARLSALETEVKRLSQQLSANAVVPIANPSPPQNGGLEAILRELLEGQRRQERQWQVLSVVVESVAPGRIQEVQQQQQQAQLQQQPAQPRPGQIEELLSGPSSAASSRATSPLPADAQPPSMQQPAPAQQSRGWRFWAN